VRRLRPGRRRAPGPPPAATCEGRGAGARPGRPCVPLRRRGCRARARERSTSLAAVSSLRRVAATPEAPGLYGPLRLRGLRDGGVPTANAAAAAKHRGRLRRRPARVR